jgi:hypothetical protein
MVPSFIRKAARYGLVLGVVTAPFVAARPSFAQG